MALPLSETELLIGTTSETRKGGWAQTNWPYYHARLCESEGFDIESDETQPTGERIVTGGLALDYLWLRPNLGSDQARAKFAELRLSLPAEPEMVASEYKPGPNELEFQLRITRDDAYWAVVESDLAQWISDLDAHPYAVCVREMRYADGSLNRRYMLPRSLVTIRKQMPRISDERRAELAVRMAEMNAARDAA